MLTIHHAEETRTPDKLYADACWLENPHLSPDWWREAIGRTVGKLGLDWRNAVADEGHLATGSNLVLVSARTWPQVQSVLAAQPYPDAFAAILVTAAPAALPAHLPPFLIWQPEGASPHQRAAVLLQFESLVKSGAIEAYGIALETGAHPLHLWLEEAAAAAAAVWARRKRPALRLVLGTLDLLDLSLLTEAVTHHKDEAVSTLELAARLGLAVVAVPAALPDDTPPPPAALHSLTHAAEVEERLNRRLGGWPQVAGRPLFSVLAHLAQGQAPWPTPAHWRAWHANLLPQLRAQWQGLAVPADAHSLVRAYLEALDGIVPHGPLLARAAAQPVLAHVLRRTAPHFPAAWQQTDALSQSLALLCSIPGVTAVAVAHANPAPLQHRPNLPDVGRILLEGGAF